MSEYEIAKKKHVKLVKQSLPGINNLKQLVLVLASENLSRDSNQNVNDTRNLNSCMVTKKVCKQWKDESIRIHEFWKLFWDLEKTLQNSTTA